ncbi:CPBP family intramembrane glutamic endopeptidase [Nonomuraea sp. NPDC005650]|uniref:CPBP family intramembrane glutamic endopeptidase n=1 Tax=Nonomuraea sp. NPDC005650 TaxID=3157045 RepID=UPI0033AC51B0
MSSQLLSWILAGGLAFYLAIVAPVVGLRARNRPQDDTPLPRRLGLVIVELWALAAAALLVVALSPTLTLADVGVKPPTDPAVTYGIAVALPVAMVPIVFFVRWLVKNGGKAPGADAYSALMPRTRGERWLAGGVAVSAGLCEELVYRGLLMGLGLALGLSPLLAAAAAVAVFALGHVYQGRWGFLLSILGGIAFTGIYLRTGSLIAPIVVHVIVDIRSLVLTPRPERVAA